MKKKWLYLFLTILTVLLLISCGTEQQEEQIEEDADQQELEETGENEKEQALDDVSDHEEGDVVENEGGTFTLISKQDEIESQETGPMIVDITQVNASSGQLQGDLADFMETTEIEYIQIDMEVENTSDDTIFFYPGQATITTNTGEQLESDMWLSDHIDGEFIGAVRKSGSQFFILENSTADEIETVRIIINAPHNEEWEDVGDKIDFTVEF
ncbi:hypothetical protein [Halalkalibacter hemicellulosilyticus]|uniref:DUF4352 domain-containing protein n=1 Tax=Halalkalibacter hemicellulosilyticusJCM 9152 TaxID=1236971 RepID=W4QD85_9BACI|nr:hypothetical protein [Halalkalibacter hemicellulosilyticus]GAE30000.1 hypothetical protein JCM9152_1391 [Halalkalibacter hemicellulosilyticusJCM 9152]